MAMFDNANKLSSIDKSGKSKQLLAAK